MKTTLCNAFSLSMIPGEEENLHVKEVCEAHAIQAIKLGLCESAIGHQSTADLLSAVTGTFVPVNRANVELKENEAILVFQYSGPRLQEGATELPENAAVRWVLVTYQEWEDHPTKGRFYFPDACSDRWLENVLDLSEET